MATDVTLINVDFLNTLNTQLGDLLTQVDAQLKGIGPSTSPGTTITIGAVDDTLGDTIQAGGASFEAATSLVAALNKMGGSVNDQLTWLHKTLTDMRTEITNTVAKFGANDTLNNEAVEQLITDFQTTIGDLGNSGTSSTSPPPPNS